MMHEGSLLLSWRQSSPIARKDQHGRLHPLSKTQCLSTETTLVSIFAIQRQSSLIAHKDEYGHLPHLVEDSMSFDRSCYNSPFCYLEATRSDSTRRPSRLSISFIAFKARRLLLMHLMSFTLFLLTSFIDWANGRSGGNVVQTKLVSYLYFPFISNKR